MWYRGLKQRREIGLENEAEAKACVPTPGEAGKSLAEPEQAGEVGRAAPATALHSPEGGWKAIETYKAVFLNLP